MISVIFSVLCSQLIFVQAQDGLYLNLISSAVVNTAPSYRRSNVPEATASSIAKNAIDRLNAMPQFTGIVNEAVQIGIQGGGNIQPSQALSLVRRASVSLENARPEPSYSSLLAYVSQMLPSFDSTPLGEARQTGAGQGQQQMSRGIEFYNSFTRNSDGYSAVVTAMHMGREIVHDAHLPEPTILEGNTPPSFGQQTTHRENAHRTENAVSKSNSRYPTTSQQQSPPQSSQSYNPYSAYSGAPYNPYGQPQYNPYGQATAPYNPYGQATAPYNPYGQAPPQYNPYGQPAPQYNPYGQSPNYYNPYAPQANPYQNGPYHPYGH